MGDAGASAPVLDSQLSNNVFKRDSFEASPIFYSDFLHGSVGAGNAQGGLWFVNPVASGTIAAANTGLVTGNHPGVIRIRSSTSANSGYTVNGDAGSMLIGGGETFEAVFNITTLTNLTLRMGFLDSITSADSVDGVYIEIPATGAAVLKTATTSARTTSSTIATLSTATWYHATIIVNSNATSVTGYIYSETGTLLGSQSNSANIPTASGNETGPGSFCATNSGTTATDLVHLDYMAVWYQGKILTR